MHLEHSVKYSSVNVLEIQYTAEYVYIKNKIG